jgi:phosphoribosylformylglycinamidine synthase
MAEVRALVVSGNGTNCEVETAFACRQAGADAVDIVTIWDLVAGAYRLDDAQLLCFPGGFMDGDDLGAARAAANRYQNARIAGSDERLWDSVRRFVGSDKLVIGICNGFQLMVKLGLLPAVDPDAGQTVTLTFNDSGRFEDRWVELEVDPASPCVFTRGLERLPLPVRHGEGKLVAPDGVLDRVDAGHLAPVRYTEPDGGPPTEAYPANPNGSPGGIAGLCDPSGRLLGLMPHPEAFVHRTHHPRWTRQPDLPEEGAGLQLFRNAVDALR